MRDAFVGRAQELALLESLLGQCEAGATLVASLTGEPGIGKTRLATELGRCAEARGWVTAWGRTWEGPGTPAFWPWTQVLRRLAAIEELRGPLREPRLQALLSPSHAPEEPADASQARFQLFDAVARALADAGAIRKLLLVFDDLHAADSATLALLHFVGRTLNGSPVLLLATSRDARFASSEQAPGLLAQIDRTATALTLPRLQKEDLRTWVEHLPAAELERLWKTSEGNPLFVRELLAAARARPGAAWTAHQLPSGIREAMRSHLALLSAQALALVEAASVLGREWSTQSLTGLTSRPAPDLLPECVSSGVLEEVGEGRLRFSHVLLRDELYAGLPEERRAALHRRASELAGSASEAAHHALLGARPEETAWAFERVGLAMREARGRLAHADAALLGQQALQTLRPRLEPTACCALLLSIAEAQLLAGDLPACRERSSEAFRLARDVGSPELLASAALLRAAEITFGRDDEAAEHLQRALAALPEGDSPLRAQVMGRLSVALNNSPPDTQVVDRLRHESVAMARRLGDERGLLEALHNASGTFPVHLAPRERFALYAETVEMAERLGTLGKVAPALCWHVVSWLELGELDGALAAADRLEALLSPYAQPHFRWRVPLTRAVVCAVAGRFKEAERLAAQAHGIAQANGVGEGLSMWAIFRSTLPYLRGDEGGLSEVMPLVEQVLPPGPVSAIFRSIWDAPAGRIEAVRRSLELANSLPIERVTGANMLGWPVARAGLAQYAGQYYQLAVDLERNLPLSFAPGGFGLVGPTALMLGQLATLNADRAAAAQAFGRARALAHELGSPPLIANAELELAELLRTDDPTRAREHAAAALEHASALELSALVERAETVLGSAPTRSPAPPASGAELARLERRGELWSLSAGGRSVMLRDSRGVGYLAALLEAPHRSLHALELTGAQEQSDAGPMLDEKARRSYRDRADHLRRELEDAEGAHDPVRAEKVREELEALGDELARAFGLGGRARRAGSAAERARINVQRRVSDVIRRVQEQDPALGRHLQLSVKTGLFCMYAPTWPLA